MAVGYTTSSTPLFAKRGEPLSTEVLARIAERMGNLGKTPSRERQEGRWKLLNHDVFAIVAERLGEQYKSDVVKEGTTKHITSALNPAVDVVGRVCQVYRHGVRRRLVGVSKGKAKAFARLYREAGIHAVGTDWNRIAYFCGPTFPFPQVRSGLMRVDTILPHRREIVLDEENPTGWPIAIAYQSATDRVVIVTFDAATEYSLASGRLEVIGTARQLSGVANDATPFPGLRFDAAMDPCDWDSSHKMERLASISKDVCVVAAVLGYTRSTQHQILLFLAGRLAGMPKGQNLANPTKPIAIELKGNETVNVQALPFDTPVTSFVEHIRFWYAAAGDATGVPSVVQGEGANVDLEFAFDGLTELRDEQLSYAESFELDLACAIVQAAHDGGHPVAPMLPSVEEVRKAFRVNFGRMARRFTDPQQEREHIDWEIRHGLISVVDVMAATHKTVDPEELLQQMRDNLDTNSEIWDWMASRNAANGGVDEEGKAITTPQANGAKGPAARDKAKVKNEPA